MTVFQTIAILLTFAAMGSYINKRFLHLPNSIGMMLFALLISWAGLAAARVGLTGTDPPGSALRSARSDVYVCLVSRDAQRSIRAITRRPSRSAASSRPAASR